TRSATRFTFSSSVSRNCSTIFVARSCATFLYGSSCPKAFVANAHVEINQQNKPARNRLFLISFIFITLYLKLTVGRFETPHGTAINQRFLYTNSHKFRDYAIP